MNQNEKSVAYAFIANGVQIYINDLDEHSFLISRLVCLHCGSPWYTGITECYICGSINPYLFLCRDCNTFQSITNSSGKCPNCGSTNLVMACPNPDCVSNQDDNKKEIDEYGGVFEKNAGMSLSEQHCLNCGSEYHTYKNYLVIVRNIDDSIDTYSKIDLPDKYHGDTIVIIKHLSNNKVKGYSVYKLSELQSKEMMVKVMYQNFKDVVNHLYPQKVNIE